MAWQTRSSRTVYENRWMHVREDEVAGPDGAGIYGVVTVRNPAVFVVAIDEHDRVCLVTVDRYATGGPSIEVPAGGTDGEDALVGARRELLEETGIVAEEWVEIGRMNALNGLADAPEHVFLARELRRGASDDEVSASQHEEGIAEVRWMPFADVLRLIGDGGISDGETIAAIAFAAIHLGRVR
ncbi:NUDIX domain-containing protein [Microbacterium rhizomatis]|uniref:NUDIX hydrolase n=1 Tax=Microbacterium rhizomatis TaxID=1631477 RepID=A0A5J5J8C2_9MICO|nr:NUDIX hydrolase [Microbacterium rhizomatis]KAA9111038.1 NUDIX hydrolase [Microbacterium rhizomatis]